MTKHDAAKYRSKVLRKAKIVMDREAQARPKSVRKKNPKTRLAKPRTKNYPELTKQERKRVAIAMITEPTKKAAAEKAGVSCVTVSKASKDPEVCAYIEELVEESLQEAEVTVPELLRELKRVGMQNMARFIKLVDGRPVPDFTRVKFADMACVQEINAEEQFSLDHKGDGVRTVYSRIKLGGKMQALDMLCKYFRIYGSTDGSGFAGGQSPLAASAPGLQVNFVPAKGGKDAA